MCKKQTVKQYKIIKKFIYKGFEVSICTSSKFGKFKYPYKVYAYKAVAINDHAKRIVQNYVDKKLKNENNIYDRSLHKSKKSCIDSSKSIINFYLNMIARVVCYYKV